MSIWDAVAFAKIKRLVDDAGGFEKLKEDDEWWENLGTKFKIDALRLKTEFLQKLGTTTKLIEEESKEESIVDSSAASDSLSEGQYEVESIKQRRIRNGKVEYFVKWKGWGSDDGTWEDGSNLMNGAKDLLLKFEEEYNKTPRRGRKPKSVLLENLGIKTGAQSRESTTPPFKRQKISDKDVNSTNTSLLSDAATPKSNGKRKQSSSENDFVIPEEPADTEFRDSHLRSQDEGMIPATPDGPSFVNGRKEGKIYNLQHFPPGFDLRKSIDSIVGSSMQQGTLMFICTLKGDTDRIEIPSNVLRYLEPQKVISYFEEKLKFNPL